MDTDLACSFAHTALHLYVVPKDVKVVTWFSFFTCATAFYKDDKPKRRPLTPAC